MREQERERALVIVVGKKLTSNPGSNHCFLLLLLLQTIRAGQGSAECVRAGAGRCRGELVALLFSSWKINDDETPTGLCVSLQPSVPPMFALVNVLVLEQTFELLEPRLLQ